LWRLPQSLLDSKDDKTLLDHAAGELADPEAFLKRVQALYQSDLEATDFIEFKDGRIFERDTSPLILNRSNIGRVWSFRDITERKHLENEVRQLAFHDALTNLPNRRLLNDRLSQAMAASKRSGCYGAMMFLDLDNFKLLNDMHGHEVGDLLLIDAAERLKSCVREIDTVARFGGDEFVVMISELDTDKSESGRQAGIIAEKVRAALARPFVLQVRHEGTAETTVEHCCTASIGVALFSRHEASQDDILKWADMAMYRAKEAGCNLIRFHDSKAGATAKGTGPRC
jgi:diguanylate cyclase (GGDEF)-like protein